MKTFFASVVLFAVSFSFALSQTAWNVSGSNLYSSPTSGWVGIGTGGDPNFELELSGGTEDGESRIGIAGTQVLYLPDQTDFVGSIFFGDGGNNLIRSGGAYDGRYNFIMGLSAGENISTGYSNLFIGSMAGYSLNTGSGNVFIGTQAGKNTTSGFSLIGIGLNALMSNTTGNSNIALGRNAGLNNATGSYNTFIGRESGAGTSGYSVGNNVTIGYRSGYNIQGNSNIFIGYMSGLSETTSNKLYIENSSSADPLIYGEFDNDIVGINGSLGVGTESPGTYALYVTGGEAYFDSPLNVNGKIECEEMEVMASVTADFVFEPNYNLLPLSKVEEFIKTNGHLPEIPSAAEMCENGIKVGEMNGKLLQKIEELTLYIIDQQKRIEALEAKMGK